jgi:cytochrome c-type biogenesis protein CcmH/NrfF
MQLAGVTAKQIIDTLTKEFGPGVCRADPNGRLWMIPYGALGLGLLAIGFSLRQSLRPKAAQPKAAPEPETPIKRIS